MIKKVGLAGYGYWGSKLARCFNELGVLRVIYDFNMVPREKARVNYPHVDVRPTYEGIDFEGVDAVVVATPPETHFQVAKKVLEAGLDVFIEKPMTTSHNDAIHLAEIARNKGCNLMVGHIYLHNSGIKAMPVPVGQAELYVQLLNEGGGPSESTREVIWAGLPHACSLALHFFPDQPEEIEVKRTRDRIQVGLYYWNGSVALLDVGDYTDRQLRRVELRQGDTRYLFDVKDPTLCTIASGIFEKGRWESSPHVEPLMAECMEFLNYKGVDPLGPKVVKLIEEIRDAKGES